LELHLEVLDRDASFSDSHVANALLSQLFLFKGLCDSVCCREKVARLLVVLTNVSDIA